MSHLPLDQFTPKVFARLAQALWSWNLCTQCLNPDDTKALSQCECPVARSERYFRFYQAVLLEYCFSSTSRIFKVHNDVFRAIAHVKTNPKITRDGLLEFVAPTCSDADERATATALVVRTLLMLECSTIYQSADRLEKGLSSIPWKDNTTIASYIAEVFSSQIIASPQGLLCDGDLRRGSKSTLRATKLRKRLKLRFRPTHDLRNHLYLDRQRGELYVFHHAAFLKEQLWASSSSSSGHCQRVNLPSPPFPLLPRQLLLEVLDSLQRVLFPLDDAASKRLLRRLVKDPNTAFDPSLLRFEYSSFFPAAEDVDRRGGGGGTDNSNAGGIDGFGGVQYQYLASRLAELREELENPPPRRWLERQLQRRSSARYIMMVTLAGVVFAVLSLIMSAIQTWIAYEAWKVPHDPSTT